MLASGHVGLHNTSPPPHTHTLPLLSGSSRDSHPLVGLPVRLGCSADLMQESVILLTIVSTRGSRRRGEASVAVHRVPQPIRPSPLHGAPGLAFAGGQVFAEGAL